MSFVFMCEGHKGGGRKWHCWKGETETKDWIVSFGKAKGVDNSYEN